MKHFAIHLSAALVSVALAAELLAQAPARNGTEKKSEAERKDSPGKKNGSAKKNGAAPTAEEVERGRIVYAKRCAICHYAASDAKKVGPGLKGISKRSTYDSDGRPVNDASLRAWIEDGGENMPAYKAVLNAEQVRDLLSYLKTL